MHSLISLKKSCAGKGVGMFLFLKCCSRSDKHFSTGMLVYRDFMSRLVSFLRRFPLMCFNLSSKSPECFKWLLLMVPRRGVSVWHSFRAILCGALFIPDMMGLRGMPSLCVLGSPYIVGILGLFSMLLIQDAQSYFLKMRRASLLKSSMFLLI